MTQTVQDLSIDDFGRNQLTAADRCDSCGAQAYIRATMASGELFFCAHHGSEFKDKLAATAIEWHDESARLYESK